MLNLSASLIANLFASIVVGEFNLQMQSNSSFLFIIMLIYKQSKYL